MEISDGLLGTFLFAHNAFSERCGIFINNGHVCLDLEGAPFYPTPSGDWSTANGQKPPKESTIPAHMSACKENIARFVPDENHVPIPTRWSTSKVHSTDVVVLDSPRKRYHPAQRRRWWRRKDCDPAGSYRKPNPMLATYTLGGGTGSSDPVPSTIGALSKCF